MTDKVAKFLITLGGFGTIISVSLVFIRVGFVDTYVQRNALEVGFVMGFAVIPIITDGQEKNSPWSRSCASFRPTGCR
jgi:hypothetical protein